MRTFFVECSGCGVQTARVSALCVDCDLARERAMDLHPSNHRRIRSASRARPIRKTLHGAA